MAPKPWILLVEDSEEEGELTVHALRRFASDLRVEVARDGSEALETLQTQIEFGAPTLVLLDLKMPRMGGLDFLQRLREDSRFRSVPVVVLTSSDDETDIRTSYRLGVNSYMQKQIDFIDFQESMIDLARYWLNRNVPPPPVA